MGLTPGLENAKVAGVNAIALKQWPGYARRMEANKRKGHGSIPAHKINSQEEVIGKIKVAIAKAGSDKALADELGVCVVTVWKWRTGKVAPGLYGAAALGRFLGVSADDFVVERDMPRRRRAAAAMSARRRPDQAPDAPHDSSPTTNDVPVEGHMEADADLTQPPQKEQSEKEKEEQREDEEQKYNRF